MDRLTATGAKKERTIYKQGWDVLQTTEDKQVTTMHGALK